ncbi:hypothetical protein FRB99_001151 [Tulasnella sp. 403]|nr:hypothetical protein FRB99_001151 [Tulasnella sp. 403]
MDMQQQDPQAAQQPQPDDDPDNVNYYPEHVEYENTEELSLDMLKDSPPGQKPLYPFSTLIRCAIKGSPQGKLLLEDIYYALEVPRPLTDRGKGCYWTINENVDPRIGVQRQRKKKESEGKRGGRGRPAHGPPDGNWYDPAIVGIPGPSRPVPGQFGYTQFDAQGNPYPLQVHPAYAAFLADDVYEPEILPDGQPDWHAIWKNELRRLRHATIEQMRAGAGPQWYKEMAETVRRAFMLPVPPPENGDNPLAGTTGQNNETLPQNTLM